MLKHRRSDRARNGVKGLSLPDSTQKDDGGPAFPLEAKTNRTRDAQGMSLRDYFAGQALIGQTIARGQLAAAAVNSNITGYQPPSHVDVAKAAYAIADAMIAEMRRG